MKKIKLSFLTLLLLGIIMLPPLANASNEPLFNGFYAIQSNEHKEYIKNLNTITYGWSRLAYDNNDNIIFTSSSKPLSANDRHVEYHLPQGYQEQVLDYTNKVNPQAKEYLQVITADRELIIKLLQLSNSQLNSQVIDPMLKMVNDLNLDGVVIDFEGLTANGTERQHLAQKFTSLLQTVDKNLGNKQLMVAVPPKTVNGRDLGYAYDYRSIGEVADTVILMAHDYTHQANGSISIAASAPHYLVEEAVANAVKLIPSDKLVLQVSLSVEQWVKTDGGFKLNTPTMDMLNAALAGKNGTVLNSDASKGYVTFAAKYNNKLYNLGYTHLQREQNGSIVDSYFYYEDERSVLSKINLAARYNLKGLSIWRLGLSDDTVWTKVIDYMQANRNGWAYGFTDMNGGYWAEQEILQMAARGVFKESADKNIMPNSPTTRAQFAEFLARSMDLKPQTDKNPFSDVATTDKYYYSLLAAYDARIVGGYLDGTMRPNDLVNREQMSAMMMRAWTYMNKQQPEAKPLTFKDKLAVSDFAKETVSQAQQLGIISGYPDGTFKPKETATRAQSLVMINRMLNLAE